MARYASLAEQYRAHREAFELAQKLGCTPKEAERQLRDRARTRRRACGTQAPEAPRDDDFEPLGERPSRFEDFPCAWMMRE